MNADTRPIPIVRNRVSGPGAVEGCYWPYIGMPHQSDASVTALQSRKTTSAFNMKLTKLYGSAFTLL